MHVSTGGFAESGALAGLNTSGTSDDLGYLTLGGRAATLLYVEGMQVTPHASVAGNSQTTSRTTASAATSTGAFRGASFSAPDLDRHRTNTYPQGAILPLRALGCVCPLSLAP